MFSFTLEQLNGWVGQFLWPFVRILALVATAPLFSESLIPVKVKIGLAFVLADGWNLLMGSLAQSFYQ